MKEAQFKKATIISTLGVLGAIGGIFYGIKKGYDGVGVTASMFLFSVPFFAAASYVSKQADKQIV